MRIAWLLLIGSALMSSCARTPAGSTALSSPVIKAEASERHGSIEVYDGPADVEIGAVARIGLPGIEWCTMTLVGADIGVTAGHCFVLAKAKFDINQELPDDFAKVRFSSDKSGNLEGIFVKRVIVATMAPDFAIVKLNREIPSETVKPAKVVVIDGAGWSGIVDRLGCAGYAAAPSERLFGKSLVISRGIRIVSEDELPARLDTNCFANIGSSGGPLFSVGSDGRLELYGVVWGVTDVEYDENGKLVPSKKIVTSVTPATMFWKHLVEVGVTPER